MLIALLAAARRADCEAFRDGLLAQPSNAITSLALLVAGAWLLRRAAKAPADRAETFVFSVAVAANALGSFLWHGPRPAGSRWAHDLAALSIPLFVAVHDLGVVKVAAAPTRLRWFVSALIGVALLLAAVPDALVPLGFASAVGVGAGELACFRVGDRPRPGRASRRDLAAWGIAIAALALAGLSFLLGRTGSPACRPESVIQWHAVWHVLAASAAVAWAVTALGRSAPER